MSKPLFIEQEILKAHALFLGQTIHLQTVLKTLPVVVPIDSRRLASEENRLANSPLVVHVGDQGIAVLFRYGAVVLFGLQTEEKDNFLDYLTPLVTDAFAHPETENAELLINPTGLERIKDGYILLHEFSVERLQIVADILAKTIVLAHYESRLATVFDQIEPFAASLQHQTNTRQQGRELLRQLGNTLLVQHKIVGRVEIIDKPELLWESPELEHLYLRLENEYEIRERHHALERKLTLISRTAETILEFMQHQTSLRVEWYIVILIVAEILLSLYDLFVRVH
jgi:uncharacterized Rmd1/YagE family protein